MSRRNFRGGSAVIVVHAYSGDRMTIPASNIDTAKAWLSGRYDILWIEKELPGATMGQVGTDSGGRWPRNVKTFIVHEVDVSPGDEWFERIEKL